MVEKGRLGEKAVVKKINHFNSFSNEITKVFAKEARSLSTTDNKNIVKLVGSIKGPSCNNDRVLEFSFLSFGRSECVSSLDKPLHILGKDDLVKYLQGIRNYIGCDIINGLYYMHINSILYRDINILVIFCYLINITIMNMGLS